jgi:ferritin-like protein
MSSEALHESPEALGQHITDQHRALVSLMEELEAVDWYNQRAKAAVDPELRAILEHNRDEEKEHAAMALEWLRRGDAKLDECLRTYLFTEGAVTAIESAGAGAGAGAGATPDGSSPPAASLPASRPDGSLGIGSLREARQ